MVSAETDSRGDRPVRQDPALWVVLLVCAGLFLLLVAIVTGLVAATLPAPLAATVSYNSEGYLYTLVMLPWIYFVTRVRGVGLNWVWVVGLGIAWMVIGFWLLGSSLPSAIKTLNETALAVGILMPYVAFRRPLPRGVAPVLTTGVLLVIAIGIWLARPEDGMRLEESNWVISLAEGVVMVFLTVIALDMVEKWILDRGAEPGPTAGRVILYATLVLVPVVVSALGSGVRVGNEVHAMVLNYLGRVHEAFIGVLFLCAAFVVIQALRKRLESVPMPTKSRARQN